MFEQYRQTRQFLEKRGAAVADRMEQNHKLRQAFQEGDYVTRDTILIEQSSNRFAKRFMLSLLPLIILFFVKFVACVFLASWVVFQWYASGRDVKEARWGWEVQKRKAMRALRRTISVGVLTIVFMLTFSYDQGAFGAFAFLGGLTTLLCAL